MTLITRVARLFQADMHAVLDQLEEPQVLLKQSIREMQQALAEERRRLAALRHEHRQALDRQAEIEQSLRESEGQIGVCLGSAKDDLARPLIRRKLENQRLRGVLSRKRETLERGITALQARIEAHGAGLEDIRLQAELLTGDGSPQRPDGVWTPVGSSVRDEDVEVALLREKQKMATAQGVSHETP